MLDVSTLAIIYHRIQINSFLIIVIEGETLSRCSTKSILPRIFSDVMASIAADWKECRNAGDVACSMSGVANLCHRFSNLIVGLHSTAVLAYCIGVVALRSDPADRELFLKMELPFDSGTSPTYELVMTTQFLHQMTAATVIGVLSALLVTLVSWNLRDCRSPRDFQIPRTRLSPGDIPRGCSIHVSMIVENVHNNLLQKN